MEGSEGKRPIRLDRLLAREGFGSRSELKKQIRDGKAVVNGSLERDPGRQIFPEDLVVFDQKMVGSPAFVYYMLNKPAGVITATEDPGERTVLDLFREGGILRRGLFPVGRLDKDTEGLLLVTDDGDLAHRLLSPRRHIDKAYFALVTGRVSGEEIRLFSEGLFVDEELTAMPAQLEVLAQEHSDPDSERVLVTIQEGKYHQVKRMFGAVGKKVLFLRRLSMGPLHLDESLAPGQFRELTEKELQALRREAGLQGAAL